MAEKIEITDEMKAAIGKESTPWPYEVTTTSVRAFARGVGYTDPVYYDIEEARKAGYRNLPAPPTYLGTPVFIPGKSNDIFSGPMDSGPTLNTGGRSNVLDGGTETEYYDTICAGDVLIASQKLSDLTVRQSQSIGQMLIMTMETSFKNQDGNLVAIQRGQVIFY